MRNLAAFFCGCALAFFSECGQPSQNAEREVCDSSVSVSGKVKKVDYLDSQKRVVKSDGYFLDTTTGNWLLSSVNEIFYAQNGKVAKEIISVPDQYLKIRPLELDSFVYNDRGLKTESVHLVSGVSGRWKGVSRHVFKYLKDDSLVFSESVFFWDAEQKKWIVSKEDYYSYDSLRRVASLLTYSLDKYDTSKVEKNFQEFFYPDEKLLPLPEN